MKRLTYLASILAMTLSVMSCTGKSAKNAGTADTEQTSDSLPTVYYIKDINPDNLIKVYKSLGREASGKKVAVKISTGESMKSHQLDPALIKPFINLVDGTIVECNTAYNGNRSNTADHLRAAEEHGYTAIAPVDIMDADGDTTLVITNGKQIDRDIVGKHLMDYDFMVVLSHFKGHQMGGFGGALKNLSIGVASADGKAYIHSAGKVSDPSILWENIAEKDDFLEAMADACKGVIDHFGKDNMLYINVANNLSVDCDCNGNPEAPQMADLGILASTDPVALDRASVDMVVNSPDEGKSHLIERINARHGTHTIDAAEALGLGSQKYKLVTLE